MANDSDMSLPYAKNELSNKVIKSLLELDENALVLIANHPNTPNEIKEYLSGSNNIFVQIACAKSAKINRAICASLEDKEEIYLALLYNPNVSIKYLFDNLNNENIKDAIYYAIDSTSTPTYVLDKIFEYNNDYLYLIDNPNISQKIVDYYIDKEIIYGKYRYILKNPAVNEKTLEYVLEKDYFEKEIVENPNLSSKLLKLILEKVVKEDDVTKKYVKSFIAKHKNASLDILKNLVKEEDKDIIAATLSNPNIDEDTIRQFYKENYWQYNRAIAVNPKTPKDLLLDLEKNGYEYFIAENPGAPIELLEKYSELKDKHLSLKLAGNPSINKTIIDNVRGFVDHTDINKVLVKNIKTDEATLNKICFDWGHLGNQVVEHPNSKFRLIERFMRVESWYSRDQYSGCTQFMNRINEAKELIDHKDLETYSKIEYILDNYNNLSAERLLALYDDKNPLIKYLILNNPNCPLTLLVTTDKRFLKDLYISTNNISNYGKVYFYILFHKYASLPSNSCFSKLKKVINRFEAEVKNGNIPSEVIYFMNNYPSFYRYLSNETISIMNNVCSNSNNSILNNITYKYYYNLKIENDLLNALEPYEEEDMVNVIPYIDEELIKVEEDNNKYYSYKIKCKTMSFLSNKMHLKDIGFGYYPDGDISSGDKEVLNILLEYDLLEPSSKTFTFKQSFFKKTYNIYSIGQRRFIRYNNSWLEVKPLKWQVDYKNKELTCLRRFDSSKDINSLFYKDALFQFYDPLSKEEYRQVKNELTKEKLLESLKRKQIEDKENKKKEEEKQKIIRETLLEKIKLTKQLEEINKKLYSLGQIKTERETKVGKQVVPIDYLIIPVNGHNEFNPDLIGYLKYIELSGISSVNLKVSGIDFRNTNISISPQVVYNKDLSKSAFSSYNINLKSFEGCIIDGADLSELIDCNEFDKAHKDKYTILPKNIKSKTLKR